MKVAPGRFWKPCLIVAAICPAPLCWSQLTEGVLHSFAGDSDGQEAYAGLVQGTDGALYGTTFQGGTNNTGLIFKINPDGSGNAPIWSFERNSIDPGGVANPSGLIQGMDGGLYGTAGFGGTNSEGSVFRVNPDGTGFEVLHSFSHYFGGPYEPTAALAQGPDDGMLYGTTQYGGSGGAGAVFKVRTNGTGYATLHNFGSIMNDGNQPQSPVIQGLDGALYGATTLGGASAIGGTSGLGTVYKLSTNGADHTILHSFMPSGGDGQIPYTAGLVSGKDGVLYGTTQQGGSTANWGSSGLGTIFRLNPDGTGFAIIHSFTGGATDGALPNSAMVMGTDGILYGTTGVGGENNQGVVFRLNAQGGGFQLLHHFGGTNDGRYPWAPLIQANDGGLFGTTTSGGDNNLGTVFRLAPSPPIISALEHLPDNSMRLSVRAASNFIYRIEASSDHRNWQPITNIINATGTFQFIDQNCSKMPMRFYRAAWVP